VAGIVAGDGSATVLNPGAYQGVAPGAGIVGLGVGDGTNILFALDGFDYLLKHPELNVVAVNNSWGRSQSAGNLRFDGTDPVNVATKMLHDAGITVVFSAGNTGTAEQTDGSSRPPGASKCDTILQPDGTRKVGTGICRFSVFGSAPWAISVAAGRDDNTGGGPGEQYLGYFSSRGDPEPQISLDGQTISYLATLTAPGVNIRSARAPTGVVTSAVSCGSAEAPACKPTFNDAFYVPVSGTSQAAPHVTGAVAVIQQVAKAHLGRLLSPDEVKKVLMASAAPMTGTDGFWDFPCGTPVTIDCGTSVKNDDRWTDLSGEVYQPYHVGAGYLSVARAIDVVLGGF
ncbi:MAG: S8 family serine peptidase, partial [Actinobacteria bacterium]|nr:S8 family serine peptidase [Actinomycetota bacterium]